MPQVSRARSPLTTACTLLGATLFSLAAQATPPPAASKAAAAVTPEDPFLWLEDVTGERALEWVKARNAESHKALAESPGFETLEHGLLALLDSDARIPYAYKDGAYYYNFWRDADHPRGVWRRTSPAEYRKPQPKWDVLIDVDALNRDEHESWVWHGAQILRAGGRRHVLVSLSRGGADASVVREYDLATRAFVPGGFELPESKGGLSWIDADTVYVQTDFGPGTMTNAGYPRVVKRWKRGTPLASAELVYEGQPTDYAVSAYVDDTPGFERHFVRHSISTYTSETFLRHDDGTLQRFDVPLDASAWAFREWMLIELRTPWTVGDRTFPAGALLVARFDDFMAGKRDLTMLFEPTAHSSLAGTSYTRHHIILNVLDDVKNHLDVLTPGKKGWKREPLLGVDPMAASSAWGVDADESDEYWLSTTGYLTPSTLLQGTIGKRPKVMKSLPAFFDASGLEVTQHFISSKDGTRVPYFQIARKDLVLDGSHPTLLYGYGGFEISLTPGYNANVGRAWLERGGVYVVANIRGGGEYGPTWHQAALKGKRLRAYEDFAAVAEDLVARKVTQVAHLGAMGGSNGGLLMGNMITLYPQLFGAIVCQAPLLDMRRYTKLLAGASWMDEYGDPENAEDWAALRTFSPYQNLAAGATYPAVLFTTSTRDDRVHPGHARKMMARMMALGASVLFYENVEGGHGGAASNAQAAHLSALAYTFLWDKLK